MVFFVLQIKEQWKVFKNMLAKNMVNGKHYVNHMFFVFFIMFKTNDISSFSSVVPPTLWATSGLEPSYHPSFHHPFNSMFQLLPTSFHHPFNSIIQLPPTSLEEWFTPPPWALNRGSDRTRGRP